MKFEPKMPEGMKPLRMSKAQLKRLLNYLDETGGSGHTEKGETLAHILNSLVENKIPFTLRYAPGGYYLTKG